MLTPPSDPRDWLLYVAAVVLLAFFLGAFAGMLVSTQLHLNLEPFT